MKDVFLLFDTACLYEIVILNYFIKATGGDIIFCSLDGQPISTTEGLTINANKALNEIDLSEIRSFIIPGGDVTLIKNATVQSILLKLREQGAVIGAICAGVDVLDALHMLDDVKSTHNTDRDYVNDKKIITARANAYVDFAIEVGKELSLFEDDNDLQETIDFWKYHKRID